MLSDQQFVEWTRHYRHDWLNRLQLIKGNLALKRLDRVEDIIDEIINQAATEAKLTAMNTPEFSRLILTYNSGTGNVHLLFSVYGEPVQLEEIAKELALDFEKVTEAVERMIDGAHPSTLHVILRFAPDYKIRIIYGLTGKWSQNRTPADLWKDICRSTKAKCEVEVTPPDHYDCILTYN